MYFITEAGFCQRFFEIFFGFFRILFSSLKKYVFSFLRFFRQLFGNADAGRRCGEAALAGLAEVGGE